MNSIYPMPIIMLTPRHDDYGTVYLPSNIFATKLNKLMGRYIKDSDLPLLESMGFGVVFPNGEPVMPFPHETKARMQDRVNITA